MEDLKVGDKRYRFRYGRVQCLTVTSVTAKQFKGTIDNATWAETFRSEYGWYPTKYNCLSAAYNSLHDEIQEKIKERNKIEEMLKECDGTN